MTGSAGLPAEKSDNVVDWFVEAEFEVDAARTELGEPKGDARVDAGVEYYRMTSRLSQYLVLEWLCAHMACRLLCSPCQLFNTTFTP